MSPPDRYVPESRGGWGAVIATPRDASKQGGLDRVRTLSAAARSSSQRRSVAYSSRRARPHSRSGASSSRIDISDARPRRA
jgi:hypothetical protein